MFLFITSIISTFVSAQVLKFYQMKRGTDLISRIKIWSMDNPYT